MRLGRAQLWGAASIAVVLASVWWWQRDREPAAATDGAHASRDTATASITGRVSRPNGEFVAGARVCAICASCDAVATDIQVCVDSDSQGQFALRHLRPIGYRVTASAPGLAPGRANRGRPVSLDAGEVKRGVDLVFAEGGAEVSGVVLDPRGRPIAGATARAVQWEGHPSAIDVPTDAEGRFKIWVKAGGTTLSATARGYAASKRLYRTAPSTSEELVLPPAGSIAGTVLRNGTPIAGAEVTAFRMGYAPQAAGGAVHSDHNGKFAIENLEPDRYGLVARGPGYRGVAEQVIEVALGYPAHGITIPVSHAARLHARVITGSARRPCEAGSAMLVPDVPRESSQRPAALPNMETIGTNGELRFEGVSEGRYLVQITCEDSLVRKPEPLVVGRADMTGLEWQLERGLALTVLVVDEDRKPIPHAKFRLVAPPPPYLPSQPGSDSLHVANAAGRFEFPATLYPGKYRVQAAYSDAAGNREGVDVELKNGMVGAEALLLLKGNARIVVNVVTPAGTPVDGLYLDACSLPDIVGETEEYRNCKSRLEARSIGGGQYQVAPVSAGSYRIELRDGINPPLVVTRDAATDFEVMAGAVVRATMVLSREAEIRGRVVDRLGKPQGNVRVEIASTAQDPRSRETAVIRRIESQVYALTDPEGAFRLHRLATGARFALRAAGAKTAAAFAQGVSAGDDVTLVLGPEEVANATTEGRH